MGSSELSISYKNWAKRIAQYQAAGINASVYTPIAQKDMQRTYSEDAYPMSDLEANIAVSAASQGTPPVTEGPRGTGGHGVLHDIGEAASNVTQDAGNLITGLPRGLYDAGKQLVSPSTYKDWAQALTGSNDSPEMQKLAGESGVDLSTYNPNKLSSLGATARMFSNLPLANLIPGISDLANATTSAGRQSMLQHPVSTALDVAGDIGGVAKAAGTEALARSGDLGDLTAQGVDINNPKALNEALKSDPSAKAALARGHLLQGSVRAVDRAATKKLLGGLVPDTLSKDSDELGKVQTLTRSVLRKAKVDRVNQLLSTDMARTSGRVNTKVSDYISSRAVKAFEPLGDDPAAMEAYTRKAAGLDGGVPAMNDAERTAFHNHQDIRAELEDLQRDKLHQTPEGLFPKNVASKYQKVVRTSAKIAQSEAKKAETEATLADRLAEYKEAAPEPLPKADLYHGSSSALQNDQISPDRYSFGSASGNFVGPGFYTTDNPEVARSYTNKGRGSTPSVYGVKWNGDHAPKMIDLDKALPQDAALAVARMLTEDTTLGEASEETISALRDQLASGAKGIDIYRNLRKAYGEAGLPRHEVDDALWGLHENLEQMGYDGFRHVGGSYAGKGLGPKHNANIFFDPAKLSNTFAKRTGDETHEDIVKRASSMDASKPYSKVSVAAKRLVTAKKAHDAALAHHEKNTADLKTHSANYRKQLLSTPPAQHTPLMRQYMRDQASEAIKTHAAQNVPSEKLAQVQYLDKVNATLKDAANTTFNKTLRTYLGTKEYTSLLSDSLEYAMKQESEGRGGIFMHSIRAGNEHRALSTKITTRDPAQLLAKGFDIAETMMNAKLAVVGEYANIAQQEGGLEVLNRSLIPHGKTSAELAKTYLPAAERKLERGKVQYTNAADLSRKLRDSEWVKISKKTGLEISKGRDHPDDFFVPRNLHANWHQFTQGSKLDSVIEGRLYSKSMKLFRTSVLYGPRHFAHVVIGGLMPLMMADPTAITQFGKLWPEMSKIMHGETPDPAKVPVEFQRPIDYKSDEGLQHQVDTAIGGKYGNLLKDFWAQTGGKVGEGLARFEDTAQTMYQSAARLQALKRGEDPTIALEMARRLVVNMDSAAPFERTIMKQIMPFYSFTRFATQFLLHYPFDHPLRVSILSSISNQAQEEWGTGLPMDMMDLFFVNGNTHSPGDVSTVNLKNINPFRSIANQFTIGGFLSSLNPGVQALANVVGVNTLSGSGEMYPEISYNAQTGSLQTTRPGGDLWTAIESYVPEFSVIDGYMGLSDNLRSLRQDDPSAWHREMFSLLNVPFTPSDYNLSQVRGNTALNLYKGASQAVQDAERTGNFSGNINRYNLVPYNNGSRTLLYTPQQIEEYFKGLQQSAATTNPGINPAALAPTSY